MRATARLAITIDGMSLLLILGMVQWMKQPWLGKREREDLEMPLFFFYHKGSPRLCNLQAVGLDSGEQLKS